MAGCERHAGALGSSRLRDPAVGGAGCRTGAVTPTGSPVGDAVEAMMLAVRALRLRFGGDELGVWERAVWLTGGLLHGRLALPP